MSKVKSQKKIFLLIFLLFFILACDKEPQIPEEKFVEVYVDFLILQDTTSTDSLSLDSLKTLIFKKHEVSSESYEETINFYNSEPKRWEEFFNKAIAYVEQKKKEAVQ